MSIILETEDLVQAFAVAESEEECLAYIIGRVAKENDSLSRLEKEDGEMSKIITKRISGLKYLSELLEQKIKIRNQTSIDPEVATHKILRYLLQTIINSLKEMNVSTELKDHLITSIKTSTADFEKIKRTILADSSAPTKK